MKTKQELLRTYPDLVGQAADPDLLRVVADLDAMHTTAEPPARLEASLDRAIASRTRNRKVNRQRPLRFPVPGLRLHGLGAVAAALLAAVLLAGAAYAVSSLIGQVMRREPGTAHVETAELGRKLDLSQTVDGVTIKVERAHADVNRIVVGYTIALPPHLADGHGGFSAHPFLTDSSGRMYPSRIGMGLREPGAHVVGDVMSFDAAGLPPGTTEMTFKLTIPELTAIHFDGTQPAVAPPETDSAAAARPTPPAGGEKIRVAGPWNFSFTIPVLPGRIAHVDQTVTAAGIPMTLDRVVVSPTETRAYLRFRAPSDLPAEQWQAMASVAVGGWDSREPQVGAGTSGPPVDGIYSVSWPASLHDTHGEWTLTVDELLGMPMDLSIGSDGVPDIKRIAGPWVFKFVVP